MFLEVQSVRANQSNAEKAFLGPRFNPAIAGFDRF
jgi:hypothetical protein